MKFTILFTEPSTGVVMLKTPVEAATEDAALKKARAFQKIRASIAHWSVSVERAAPTPHAALAPRQMPLPGTQAPKGPKGPTTFTKAWVR